MSTYLAPASGSSSSNLPTASALSLLPFSLGTASTPFSTASASTAQFFQPRPCPANVPGIPEGMPVAAFRGRQLVGHSISVPKGYRGLVISAPLPHQIETKWPLTPAPSVASSSSVPVEAGPSTRRSPRKSALASVASTIKAKVRGAGQIALSKPKTRQTKREPVKRKRYQFDSDEEDEDAHVEHSSGSANVKTPKKEASSSVVTEEADLPKIVVQEATPLKEPLPTPKKRLGQRGSIEEGLPKKRSRSRSPDGSPTPSSSASTEVSVTVSEAVIPSPATEDDQPAFSVETPKGDSPAQAVESEQQVDQSHIPTSKYQNTLTRIEVDEAIPDGADANEQDGIPNEGIPTNARLLQPSSTFESFTLWSPDGPLPGFKQDESNTQATEGEEAEGEGGEQGGVKLRKGWWRTGGAGEGGDEIVRALGEWIGLVDELNRPVYLDDLKDEDSEEE